MVSEHVHSYIYTYPFFSLDLVNVIELCESFSQDNPKEKNGIVFSYIIILTISPMNLSAICCFVLMVGFGVAYGGAGAVFWGSLARVISSWAISPLMLMRAAVLFLVYKCIRRVCTCYII